MNKPTGGPAYPVPVTPGGCNAELKGMTLRDHFAGLAMQAIIAMPDSEHDSWYDEGVVAHNAYKMADAMITARSKPCTTSSTPE